jgi:transcriptional regulator with XRE-family HTH domain
VQAAWLNYARKKAGFSQRALAERSGVTQATIARIEKNEIDPRIGTMARLLRACGYDLEVAPLAGMGVDRTAIRELLNLSPTERVRLAAEEARNLEPALPRRVR